MSGFTESGITLNFPTNTWFRLQDCKTYKDNSGYHFKEMDACWLDAASNIFYLIELKDFTNASLETNQNIEQCVRDMVKKSIDSLQMINATLLSTNKGVQFQNEIQCPLRQSIIYKYISIIKIKEEQKGYLNTIKDKYNNSFKAYADLFDIQYYSVISYEAAKMYFSTFVF